MPVFDRFVSISTGLVPEPALCPDAGAAERSQGTQYVNKINSGFERNIPSNITN